MRPAHSTLRDTARLLGTPRRLPGPAPARHECVVPAAQEVSRAQPDAYRHRSRPRSGPDERVINGIRGFRPPTSSSASPTDSTCPTRPGPNGADSPADHRLTAAQYHDRQFGQDANCSGRSPRPAGSTAPSSGSCRARRQYPVLDRRLGAPAVAGKLEATSATSRPACATPCAPGTASSSPGPGRRLRASRWQAIDMSRLPRAWATSSAPPPPPAKPQTLPAPFAAGEQAYVLLDLHRPARPWPWSGRYAETTRRSAPGPQLATRCRSEMAAAAGRNRLPPRPRRAAREIGYGAASQELLTRLNETHLAVGAATA